MSAAIPGGEPDCSACHPRESLRSSRGLREIMSNLADLEKRALAELAACADEAALRAWNTKYFGNNGEVLAALKAIGGIPKEERKEYGQTANRIKEALTAAYEK